MALRTSTKSNLTIFLPDLASHLRIFILALVTHFNGAEDLPRYGVRAENERTASQPSG